MSKGGTILVVDDDPNILMVLSVRLEAAGYDVVQASDGPEALAILKKKGVDLMISDVKMPEMNGMELYAEARRANMSLPVIFLTAYGTIPDAVMAVKAGAIDYITKPFDGRDLVSKVNALLADTVKMPKFVLADDEGEFYWGKNRAMHELRDLIQRAATSNANILILGESGVGKECIAKMVHDQSSRRGRPYIVVDCGSTPPGILESELFGHMRGAFTNAVQDKQGLIEAADSGTLFLDEIGNISADMQSRLLRFLEDRKIRRVGSVKEKDVDCRVISATNADLQADIKKGTFRQDLFYRLKVVTLTVPPLRERKEDIPALARYFVAKQCRQQGIQPIEIAPETLEWLCCHDWPGNVRELKNGLEAGVVLCRKNIMYPADLQLVGFESVEEDLDEKSSFSIKSSEKDAIIRALKETGGVQKHAAELLDISRRSIHYKIKKYNITVADYKS